MPDIPLAMLALKQRMRCFPRAAQAVAGQSPATASGPNHG
jgi:hypothetical protein